MKTHSVSSPAAQAACQAGSQPAPYVCASFPAWTAQAAHAIAQGQTLNEFVAHCYPDNRSNARKAYLVARAARAHAESGGKGGAAR